jgi:hypothetical protein
MMDLQTPGSRAFVLLMAEWEVQEAIPLVRSLAATHVIIHRRGTDLFYLYNKPGVLGLLSDSPSKMTVHAALKLREDLRTSTVQADAARPPGGPVVIVDDGRAAGFIAAVSKGTRSITDSKTKESPFNLVADFPEIVKLGSTTSLLLSITLLKRGRTSLPLSLPKGSKLDIVVQPKDGFEIEGASEGSLEVKVDEALRFKLKAVQAGSGRVNVFAFYNNQALGLLKIDAQITTKPAGRIATKTRVKGMSAGSTHSPPDLSLIVFEQTVNGKAALSYRVSSTDKSLGLNLKQFGPVTLQIDPFGYFEQFFQDIENLPLDTAKDKVLAEKMLAAKGLNLFKTVVPKDLQLLLWSLKDRISAIQIQSEEPWIPWEMCKLQGMENGRMIEGPFLCEGFPVTRWLLEIGFKPNLSSKKMGLVVPGDSGLSYAPSEKQYLLSLAKQNRSVEKIPANVTELMAAMSEGKHDIWHFSGHGGFRDPDPNRSGMVLENRETLTPEHISGVVENLGLTNPLVFLNACQIGKSAMSLTGIGGWAAKFLQAQAGAFIGAYWSVYDQAAHDFAKEFYGRAFGGVPLGKAVQEARLAIRPLGDPTWLAYTVFADPYAVIS